MSGQIRLDYQNQDFLTINVILIQFCLRISKMTFMFLVRRLEIDNFKAFDFIGCKSWKVEMFNFGDKVKNTHNPM